MAGYHFWRRGGRAQRWPAGRDERTMESVHRGDWPPNHSRRVFISNKCVFNALYVNSIDPFSTTMANMCLTSRCS